MKRLNLIIVFLAAFIAPIFSQAGPDYLISEKVSILTATIPKDKIPSAIDKGVNVRFDKDNPLTWSRFPRELKDFGWVYEVGSNQDSPLTGFDVTMKTNKGSILRANYDASGKLLESTERSENIPVPSYIIKEISSGMYKDWKITGNREIIQFYSAGAQPSADQYFRLILQKGNERKKLAFKYEGNSGKFQAVAWNLK